MALVGDAIATSLAPGDNKTLVADGLRLDVASSTVATLPASVGAPGSVPARRRLTRRATTSCAINFGTGLTTALTPLVNPSGIVVTKSTCLDVNPFPSTNVNATNAGTSTLTAGYLALAVSQQINGANTPITIGTLAQPIKVYVPTTWTPRTAMVRREQHIFSRRTDTYTVQCIVQPTGQTAFTTDGCTATSGTVGGAGTTCSCTTVGSYSVQVKVTSVEDPPPGGPVTGSSGITKGGIAGAVIGSIAGAALIGAAVWYFAFKRPANKGQQMSQR
ncbi:hypothetical protein DFS34DRAFT_616355 [Phlyctochytrium arcticum]|nr:hypothetical protein DFS34DRAFT_616355 [Phlyctochytrium arcticum]